MDGILTAKSLEVSGTFFFFDESHGSFFRPLKGISSLECGDAPSETGQPEFSSDFFPANLVDKAVRMYICYLIHAENSQSCSKDSEVLGR